MAVEKEADGRLRVRFSTGDSDVFDTVLSARGRYPDLTALNAAGIGLATDGASGKLLCRHEQTSVPHVYAVGDVVQGTPELTPVAIQAGVLLARRYVWGCVVLGSTGPALLPSHPSHHTKTHPTAGSSAARRSRWTTGAWPPRSSRPSSTAAWASARSRLRMSWARTGLRFVGGRRSVGRSVVIPRLAPPLSSPPTKSVHPHAHPTGVPLRVPAPRVGPRARAAGGQRILQGACGQARRPRARAALLRPQRRGGHPGLCGGHEGGCM